MIRELTKEDLNDVFFDLYYEGFMFHYNHRKDLFKKRTIEELKQYVFDQIENGLKIIGYYNNEQATNEYFHIDVKGFKWNCTGDVGYIDEDGQLYVQGRATDFTIVNEQKIYNFDIEKVLMLMTEIKNCDVVSRNNEDGTQSLVAHVIINDGYSLNEELLEKFRFNIYSVFGDVDYVPNIFKIRESFPYAPSGKRDVNKMKLETDGFIELPEYSVKTKQITNK